MQQWYRVLSSAAASVAALFALVSVSASRVSAQSVASPVYSAPVLGTTIQSLGTTGRVLFIAAHPDDEDTELIAWLARGRHVETAYLSLTRGDGGQNLIGNELGDALGVIRTQELLAARRLDGGKQFFTRAYDFGFSKSADETFEHWPRDSVLSDVVRVVRTFRPHVIIAIFSGTPRDGHGHHQVSGILARDAYDMSADTVRFPVASHGAAWTVQKLYRDVRFRPDDHTLRMNVGEYSPLLGRSYAELAAESRSQHKSQGFGMLQQRGVRWGYLQREASRVNDAQSAASEQSLFDGVDTTWARLANYSGSRGARTALDSVQLAFAEAKRAYRAEDPTPVVEPLARALRLLRTARSVGAREPIAFGQPRLGAVVVSGSLEAAEFAAQYDPQRGADVWDALTTTIERVERALVLAAGVSVEATAERDIFPVRDPVKTGLEDSLLVDIAVYNRGKVPVRVLDATIPRGGGGVRTAQQRAPNAAGVGITLAPDSQLVVQRGAVAFQPTQPWWLQLGRRGVMFTAPVGPRDEFEQQLRTRVSALARLEIAGVPVDVVEPVVRHFADPVKGDQRVPVAAVPGIVVGLDNVVEYIRADVPIDRLFRVHIASSYRDTARVEVSLNLPAGLTADSAVRIRTLTPDNPQMSVVFRVTGRIVPGRHQLGAIAHHEGSASTSGFYTINYDHIPPQRMYAVSGMWLQAVPVVVASNARVGYIEGVGDHGAEALRQLDVQVSRIDPATLNAIDLSRFTTIVIGPRAYDVHESLARMNHRLMSWVREGGNLVVQYGQYEMLQPGIMPYPIELTRPAARVTREDAPVRVLMSSARTLTFPNRIGDDDWEGWVQERSIYMPSTFDARYTPLLALNDPDEPENRGGLLVADVGRGRYVYVTLSLFRQWPNGVPGAARLLGNLVR